MVVQHFQCGAGVGLAAGIELAPGTNINLDCLGGLIQPSAFIDEAGEVVASIEQTGQ